MIVSITADGYSVTGTTHQEVDSIIRFKKKHLPVIRLNGQVMYPLPQEFKFIAGRYRRQIFGNRTILSGRTVVTPSL